MFFLLNVRAALVGLRFVKQLHLLRYNGLFVCNASACAATGKLVPEGHLMYISYS